VSSHMAPNSRFEYLYRDASNYKTWGSVVFSRHATHDLLLRVLRALESSEFFIADQVRVPELFFELPQWPLEQDDHCWHEFSAIESTTDEPSDSHARTIDDFVADVEHQSALGWKIFDPMSRVIRRSSSPG